MADSYPTPRLALLREIVTRPLARVVAGVLALMGTASTIREVALPQTAQAKFDLYRLWTLAWPWWLWVLFVLVAAAFVLFEGGLAAVRKREATVLEVQNLLSPRPFVTVEYSSNATEEEPELSDTLIFRNIGTEPALAVRIETVPASFAGATPRLGWPVNQILPNETKETSVFSLDGLLHRLSRAVLNSRGRCPELRIPLRLRYSDPKGRAWCTEYAAVRYVGAPRIEDISGTVPEWSDLSDVAET